MYSHNCWKHWNEKRIKIYANFWYTQNKSDTHNKMPNALFEMHNTYATLVPSNTYMLKCKRILTIEHICFQITSISSLS